MENRVKLGRGSIGVICNEHGEFLLLRHKNYGNKLGFPGGKFDDGAADQFGVLTLQRELKEELGLAITNERVTMVDLGTITTLNDVDNTSMWSLNVHTIDHTQVDLSKVYLAEPHKHSELGYFSQEDIIDLHNKGEVLDSTLLALGFYNRRTANGMRSYSYLDNTLKTGDDTKLVEMYDVLNASRAKTIRFSSRKVKYVLPLQLGASTSEAKVLILKDAHSKMCDVINKINTVVNRTLGINNFSLLCHISTRVGEGATLVIRDRHEAGKSSEVTFRFHKEIENIDTMSVQELQKQVRETIDAVKADKLLLEGQQFNVAKNKKDGGNK